MPSAHYTIEEVDRRIQTDGSAEMQRHWQIFRDRGSSLSDLDAVSIDERISRHCQPHGWVCWLSCMIVGGLMAYGLTVYSFSFVRSEATRTIILVWSAINLTLLLFHAVTLLRRYLGYPMESLIGEKLACSLMHREFRAFWSQSPRWLDFRSRVVDDRLVEKWDNPEYDRLYLKQEGQWQSDDPPSPAARIHQQLIRFLGHKDPVSRRFKAGDFYDALREHKRSVTRFVGAHQSDISDSRNGCLPINAGLELLERLLEQEVVSESSAARELQQFIQAGRSGGFDPVGGHRVQIWKRDPWQDLTHQREFFSSASLRGVCKTGRGTKGRMGTFLYLDDPCVSALDFSVNGNRKVRVRMGLAVEKSLGKPILYVDGIEGTNALERRLVTKAIADYASHCQLNQVAFLAHPHNRVPRYYLKDLLAQNPVVTIRMQYVLSNNRQYLDGFGFPVEPLEYAYPNGRVQVVLMPTSDKAEVIGQPPTKRDWIRSGTRRSILWLILASAIGHASLSIALSNPWMLIGLAGLTCAGIVAHFSVQRAGMN